MLATSIVRPLVPLTSLLALFAPSRLRVSPIDPFFSVAMSIEGSLACDGLEVGASVRVLARARIGRVG
jgi:hypothetical protein